MSHWTKHMVMGTTLSLLSLSCQASDLDALLDQALEDLDAPAIEVVKKPAPMRDVLPTTTLLEMTALEVLEQRLSAAVATPDADVDFEPFYGLLNLIQYQCGDFVLSDYATSWPSYKREPVGQFAPLASIGEMAVSTVRGDFQRQNLPIPSDEEILKSLMNGEHYSIIAKAVSSIQNSLNNGETTYTSKEGRKILKALTKSLSFKPEYAIAYLDARPVNSQETNWISNYIVNARNLAWRISPLAPSQRKAQENDAFSHKIWFYEWNWRSSDACTLTADDKQKTLEALRYFLTMRHRNNKNADARGLPAPKANS
ncbi:MAG: hypothetical protein ACK5O7_07010 [Holosporales bacterium]